MTKTLEEGVECVQCGHCKRELPVSKKQLRKFRQAHYELYHGNEKQRRAALAVLGKQYDGFIVDSDARVYCNFECQRAYADFVASDF